MKRSITIGLFLVITLISIIGVNYYKGLYDGMDYESRNRLVKRIYPNATLISECIRDKDHNYIIGEIETTDNQAGLVVFEKKNPEKRIINASEVGPKDFYLHHTAIVNGKWEHIYYHNNNDIVNAEITITEEGKEPYTYTDQVCGNFFFVEMPEGDHNIEIKMFDKYGNTYE